MNKDAIPPKKKSISISNWKTLLILTIISWFLFIFVLLCIIYYPPPNSSNPIIPLLCEGLRLFAYTMTGIIFGYPIGESAASIKSP